MKSQKHSSRTSKKKVPVWKLEKELRQRNQIQGKEGRTPRIIIMPTVDNRTGVKKFFSRLKKGLPPLVKLLEDCDQETNYEDGIYRFYHHSYKVYGLQYWTLEIVKQLKKLAPGHPLNEWFMTIVREGTGKTWKKEDNANWLEVTRPIVEAFFHAHYFLEMAVKHGQELEEAPMPLPSGWAAVLYLYDLR